MQATGGMEVMTQKPFAPSEVASMAAGLNRLAKNLWWTWNKETQEIFHELSPRGWQNLYHNGVAVLHEVSEYELRMRLQDKRFACHVKNALRALENYLEAKDAWAHTHAPGLQEHPVAYFSRRCSTSTKATRRF